jgi:hypothetical protein
MRKYLNKFRKAWRSKTIWFNAVAALTLAYSDQILSLLPQLQMVIGPHDYQTALTVITVANVALRFVTTHPLEAK